MQVAKQILLQNILKRVAEKKQEKIFVPLSLMKNVKQKKFLILKDTMIYMVLTLNILKKIIHTQMIQNFVLMHLIFHILKEQIIVS